MRWLHPWLLVAAFGCASPAVPSLDDLAEQYVRVALQLAQHDPTLVEQWRGTPAWRPGPRQPVAPLLERIAALQQALADNTEPAADDRRAYLSGQLAALEWAARRLLGASGTFGSEARSSFGFEVTMPDQAAAAASREALSAALPGGQPLALRYAEYRQRLAVPAAKADDLMQAALEACRGVARDALGLPADESIELVFANESAWDGFAEYLGGHRTRITVNRRAAMDVTRALRLACHEGYPGHHWQFMAIDDELVKRRGWQEFNLVPMFGRHLLVNEGAAEVAADLAFPLAARVALYRDVLFPLAGLPSAEADRLARIEDLIASLEPTATGIIGDYLDGRNTQVAAANRLRDEALTLDPDALLAFAERFRARVLAYSGGRAAVRRTIGDGGAGAIKALYADRPFALR